jgi:hypothetical protein
MDEAHRPSDSAHASTPLVIQVRAYRGRSVAAYGSDDVSSIK